MKATIIGVIVMVVMIVVFQFKDNTTLTYIKESTVEVIPEAKESWMLDEDAIQAAKDVIRKKELQSELNILKDLQASTTAKIKEIEKELGTF